MVRIAGREAMERCTGTNSKPCKRGELLALADKLRKNPPDARNFKPTLSSRAARQAAEALSLLPDYPRATTARSIVAEEIMALCRTPEQARWLVQRMVRLYSRWPSLREMRVLFCQRFIPADGIDMGSFNSEIFVDGFPSEFPAVAPPPMKELAPGAVSADPEWDAKVKQLAVAKTLDPRSRPV